MYIPKPFEVTDKDEIFKYITANAFGQLVSTVNRRLFSTHLPFLLSDDKTQLLGHLALQNPQYHSLEGQALDDQEVMVVLQGEHGYVSPSWYVGKGVPTWNYQAVHIYGRCKVFRDAERLHGVIDALTQKYESDMPNPWSAEYNPKLLNAIVGVEITITDVECKYKLSQNRSEEDRENVVKQLEGRGEVALAKAMKDII